MAAQEAEADSTETVKSDLDEANGRLRDASTTAGSGTPTDQTRPPRQPPLRRRPPPELRRIDNPIPVPQGERAWPTCGGERECIGHYTTEVIDLLPAEVVVRVDRREKLACKPCEGELARAAPGDKVVSGGKLGASLVGTLIVDKYEDGLPLHRQKQRFARLGCESSFYTEGD